MVLNFVMHSPWGCVPRNWVTGARPQLRTECCMAVDRGEELPASNIRDYYENTGDSDELSHRYLLSMFVWSLSVIVNVSEPNLCWLYKMCV